jgi:ectoine hydroxylase-related dioxygenase (phytanoyl-CoA dioxygenase family)
MVWPMRTTRAGATVDGLLRALREDGYVIVEDMLDPEDVRTKRSDLMRVLAETPTGRNPFEGFSTRRVYALFAKTRTFDETAIDPLLLGVLDAELGHYQLSAPVGIQIGPGETAQALHRDEGIYPLPRPHPTVVVNSMWPLDDFSTANGATRFVPGSHRWEEGRSPGPDDEVVVAEMPAGSMLLYLGNLVHGGGANQTDAARLGVILEYVVSWLRPQENHCLAVPRAIVGSLPERLQELLGYNIYPPFLGYVDGRHPRSVLGRAE